MRQITFSLLLLCYATIAACDAAPTSSSEEQCQLKPTLTFNERIEPLLSQSAVSTCSECHLSGVNLSAFARETPCKTWACLVEQRLVDTESAEDSKILAWIERAKPQSTLITAEVIQAERDAFRDWIAANLACPQVCAGVACGEPSEGTNCEVPNADPPPPTEPDSRGCSERDIEQAFYEDVYSWRSRCFPCHFDTETKASKDAPRWLSSMGNCQIGSAVSLKRVVSLGLLNLEEPSESLLLRKPLDEAGGGVKHGGGQKFEDESDPTYQAYRRFIQHYQSCRQPL